MLSQLTLSPFGFVFLIFITISTIPSYGQNERKSTPAQTPSVAPERGSPQQPKRESAAISFVGRGKGEIKIVSPDGATEIAVPSGNIDTELTRGSRSVAPIEISPARIEDHKKLLLELESRGTADTSLKKNKPDPAAAEQMPVPPGPRANGGTGSQPRSQRD